MQDLALVTYTVYVRKSYSWPDPDGLGLLLGLWDARLSVGYSDLLGTGLSSLASLDASVLRLTVVINVVENVINVVQLRCVVEETSAAMTTMMV